MLRAVPDNPVKFLCRNTDEPLQILGVLYFIDQHDEGHLIFPVQKLLVAVVMDPDDFIAEIGNPFRSPQAVPNPVPQVHVGSPSRFALIIHHGHDDRITESLPLCAALLFRLLLPTVFRPYAHHVPEQLHGYIVVHQALVFNQRDEERRVPLPPDVQDPDLLHGVGLELRPQVGQEPLGNIIDVLGLHLLQQRHVEIVPEKLGAQDRIVENALAVQVPVMGIVLSLPFCSLILCFLTNAYSLPFGGPQPVFLAVHSVSSCSGIRQEKCSFRLSVPCFRFA